jgi:hypothetical protein
MQKTSETPGSGRTEAAAERGLHEKLAEGYRAMAEDDREIAKDRLATFRELNPRHKAK